nr:immunoglobulin heavy chain junction region [Macaca mulatta]MOW87995.1 immunoglobulin heavy chain junction region [Macaca mulatta]MOW89770.1 immunoglobulin heavy chain junction region [Macaca mulatta]MOW91285.1 immunoglobulin heavy chain junction region [Macaca mulatta]MOW91325.1 immunoglobulin heavy chain junction region [Macaca mulatta]
CAYHLRRDYGLDSW